LDPREGSRRSQTLRTLNSAYEWGMESDGTWMEGQDLTFWANEKPPQDRAERLSPAIVQSLSQ